MTAGGEEDRTEVVGRRIGAGLLDLVALFALAFVLALLVGDTEASDGNASFDLEGGGALLWIGLSFLYYAIPEAAVGQTLGKRLLGVRVVAVDGGKAGVGQVLVRTALRVIDGFGFYLMGLVVVLSTGPRRQRIGDLAAKTRVVAAGERR